MNGVYQNIKELPVGQLGDGDKMQALRHELLDGSGNSKNW